MPVRNHIVIMKNIQSAIKQVQHESDAWKRKLEFLLQENAYLKNRLAELLNERKIDRNIVETAELYLNRFVRKDEIIFLFRYDIAEFDEMLKNENYDDKVLVKAIEHKNKMMSKELQKLDTTFKNLKIQFNNFLADIP